MVVQKYKTDVILDLVFIILLQTINLEIRLILMTTISKTSKPLYISIKHKVK